MSYSYITWAGLQMKLFERLGDNVFYTNTGAYPEITLYLREALRVWNVMARFYRSRISFQTTNGNPWYKLTDPALVTVPANTLNFTMKIRDVVAEMQTMLMEPVSPTVWTGTDMFDLDFMVSSIQRRRDQFLLETACTVSRLYPVINPISAEGRMDLPENIADLRRISWVDNISLERTQLWRRDEWAARSQQYNWTLMASSPPTGYSLILTPPLGIQLVPPPSGAGQLDVIAVENGPVLDVIADTLMGVPDDFVWAIKYGALADMLGQEGQARDFSRQDYCEQRWEEGIALAALEPNILNVLVNNIPVPINSLQDADSNSPGWENITVPPTPDPPSSAIAYRDMLALNPVPNGIYGITADVLRPAPIPVNDADFVQIGPEQLDAVIDYAHHIASFKESGAEFDITQRQFKNLVERASNHNDKLQSLAVFREVLEDRSIREDFRRPRKEKSEVVGAS